MLRPAPVRFTFASAVLVGLGLLVGCGLKSPFEPAFVEVERKKAEEAEARYKAELEKREAVRAEITAHHASFRVLAAKTKLMVSECPKVDDVGKPPRAKGKVLIWDAMEDKLSDAHLRLPADVRATDPSGPISVFLITEKERSWTRKTFAPLYHSGGKPGVQILPMVCLIEMPKGEPVGRVKFYGQEPNATDAKRQWDTSNEIVGDWPQTVADWAVHSATGKKPETRIVPIRFD
jgi:hypothetical protein